MTRRKLGDRSRERVRRPAETSSSKQERKALFDDSIARAPSDQRAARNAYLAAMNRLSPARRPRAFENLPGALDQKLAVAERLWRHGQTAALRRGYKSRMGSRPYQRFAVTLASPKWIEKELPEDPRSYLSKMRKGLQRQAKKLPQPSLVYGTIDLADLNDKKSGVRGWAFHSHLTMLVPTSSSLKGREAVRRAFPYQSDSAKGVPRPRLVRHAFDLKNWDRYQDKAFQFGGVRQRVVKVGPDDKRAQTRKPPLRLGKKVQLARFMAEITPADLMIWVGHRRYNDKVTPMPCHRGRARNRRSSGK